jgi:hypothetical protein
LSESRAFRERFKGMKREHESAKHTMSSDRMRTGDQHFFDRVYSNLHNVLENHHQLNPCSDDLIFYILQSDIKHILIQKGSNLEF